MPKILVLTLHRKDRSPGQRFRYELYLDYLKQQGLDISCSNILSSRQDEIFYGLGNCIPKIMIGLSAIWIRTKDLFRANGFDYIFIYRDAFFFGIFFEKLFSLTNAKLIFDFDDAIWLNDKSPNPSFFQKLKNPAKTKKIISYCDLIIAGNEYLANYARQFNNNVMVIPTTIDLNRDSRIKIEKNEKICIGWTGSFSTIKHFESAIDPLKVIKKKFGELVTFKVIGNGNYKNNTLNIKGLPWEKDTEIADLCEIDIGIMPLPNDDWSKGKCGLKGLQYMALEIPTIMTPVGVNSDIIQDGENGFLASSEEEWVEKLSLLIENKELRKKLGKAGRKTVEKDYSVEANKHKWLKAFQS